MKKFAAIATLMLAPLFRAEAQELNRQKLWSALDAAAARRGWTLPEQVRPEKIEWSAPSSFSDTDAPIQVQGIAYDPLLHQLRFRFHLARKASAPWFSAWCPSLVQPVSGGQAVRGEPFQRHADAVSTHRLATLHLRSVNSFATLQVRPLEAGAIGQSIRVRVPSNGHTLRASVVGSDLLEAEF